MNRTDPPAAPGRDPVIEDVEDVEEDAWLDDIAGTSLPRPLLRAVPNPAPRARRRSRLEGARYVAAVVAALGALLVAAALIGVGPAASKAHAAELAPAGGFTPGNTGTVWVGQQAVTMSVSLSGPYAGMPHVCVRNNGPDAVRIIRNDVITQSGHRMRFGGGASLLAARSAYCVSGGWVARISRSYYRVAVADPSARTYGSRIIPLRS